MSSASLMELVAIAFVQLGRVRGPCLRLERLGFSISGLGLLYLPVAGLLRKLSALWLLAWDFSQIRAIRSLRSSGSHSCRNIEISMVY